MSSMNVADSDGEQDLYPSRARVNRMVLSHSFCIVNKNNVKTKYGPDSSSSIEMKIAHPIDTQTHTYFASLDV